MTTDRGLSDKLHKDGYRVTQQRRALLDELKRLGGHPTAAEVYDAVKQKLPQISLGTVYRNLGVLTELGFLRRILREGSYCYDANVEAHYHIVCVECGAIADVPTTVADRIDPEALEKTGYALARYELEFYGVCPECQQAVITPTDGSPSSE